MRRWGERSYEVAYLLNPAFCGRLLYSTIRTYCLEVDRAFPFPLVYLILPLVLHKKTREKISSKTQLLVWIQRHEYLLVGYAKRTEQLIAITNEAIELLLQSDLIAITSSGELELRNAKQALSKTKFADDEIKECINKSEHIAKWFAKAGKTETIYVSLGVRP